MVLNPCWWDESRGDDNGAGAYWPLVTKKQKYPGEILVRVHLH
jgi:hypothetical protein